MVKIAYILLCHKDPEAVIAQARRLTAVGDFVAIHFDARASAADFAGIKAAFEDNPRVAFTGRRLKCGWGEWSLVEATLMALRAGIAAFPRATHFYMISGDCMPIKSAEYTRDFLAADACDYIETNDYFESDWIKTGFKEERLIYRHHFNERTAKRLFYASFEVQKALRLSRAVPDELHMMIGSQWWCLRRTTIEALLDFCDARRDILRFFRTTWIPDETFFQTLAAHLVPRTEIRNRTPTFLIFSDYGMPVTFYNDHYDLLLSQNYLFARKISPEADELKRRLGDLYASEGATFRISDEGRRLYDFLTGRGRVGRRFTTRFWEKESTLGRERELLVLVCKKWHVAKRLTELMRRRLDLPAIDYLFDEEATDLPDLGGIQTTLDKRARHRRALVRMLFDYFAVDRLAICLDPSNLDLLLDFERDRSTTRILEIECQFTDTYLMGHARRVGLAGANTPPRTAELLLPTIRADVFHESDAINDAGLAHLHHFSERAMPAANAAALAAFLSIPPDTAREIAATPHLFTD